jgi:hypothetical protein
MLNLQAQRKSEYHDQYLPADKWVGINEDDSVLTPIYLILPSPPNIMYIDGYGKPPLEQKWKRLEVPQRLKMLEAKALEQLDEEFRRDRHETVTAYKIQERFWSLLYDSAQHYKPEIDYIKRIHYYMLYGYWFFVKGKPTWITPWHFTFLQYCYMPEEDDPYVEYRDRDRKSEIFEWYEYTTKETFKDLSADGRPILNTMGEYEMKEMSNRTCHGDQEPKRRRGGASMRAFIKLLWIAITGKGRKCIITSFTPVEAKEKIWKPIVLPIWQEFPLFLKPVNDMSDNPENALIFMKPRTKFTKLYLNSKIFLAENSKLTASDGGKSQGRLDDEQGKIAIVDTEKRWGINKLTMCQGARIFGFAKHPSTVEEMGDGGREFQSMWYDSNFYVRREDGQTLSGLFRQFWKAWDAYDGFVDPWGFSVIETPTKEQLKYASEKSDYKQMKIGAKDYLLGKRKMYLLKGDPKSLEKYREIVRKEPIDSTESFLGSSGSIGFDIQILDNRIKELEAIKKQTVPGNFKWKDDIKFGYVEWEPREDGKFESSITLNINETNRRLPGEIYSNIQGKNIKAWMPEHPNRYIGGSDPVEFTNKSEAKLLDKKTRSSDPAFVLKVRRLKKDISLDKREWEGDRVGLTYRYRSESVDEYCEDILMACIYTESLLFFERNKGTSLWRYFVENGFGRYLGYGSTPDGKVNELPGNYLGGANKSEGFELTADHIKYRGHKEVHIDILKEWREISGPEMLKKYDLVAAYIQCELGERSGYVDYLEQVNTESTIDISDFLDYMDSQNYL